MREVACGRVEELRWRVGDVVEDVGDAALELCGQLAWAGSRLGLGLSGLGLELGLGLSGLGFGLELGLKLGLGLGSRLGLGLG